MYFIKKPGMENYQYPIAYRPISLTISLDNVFAYLIKARHEKSTDGGRQLSSRQFGFRKESARINAWNML